MQDLYHQPYQACLGYRQLQQPRPSERALNPYSLEGACDETSSTLGGVAGLGCSNKALLLLVPFLLLLLGLPLPFCCYHYHYCYYYKTRKTLKVLQPDDPSSSTTASGFGEP